MLEFGDIKLLSEVKDLRKDFKVVYDNDYEIIMLSNKTYEHREDDFNFDYKYAICAFDLFDATGDEEFEENPFSIEIHLVPSPTSLDKKIKEDIMKSMGGYCEYEDIIQYGLSVRILYDNNESFPVDNIIDKMYEIANLVEGTDRLRGFYLDRPLNLIGSIGWDVINNVITGKSFITATFDRYEEER